MSCGFGVLKKRGRHNTLISLTKLAEADPDNNYTFV